MAELPHVRDESLGGYIVHAIPFPAETGPDALALLSRLGPLQIEQDAFTVCCFGSGEFLPECPYVLALVEFEGVNTLFLTRLMGVDPAEA